ncbi:hypothetical protein [Roseiflexus sp.]|uniref:hypothetical protein n=1 Tax=Roseiflexus sp. TaxID=2562120 RepID=UPI00398BB43B
MVSLEYNPVIKQSLSTDWFQRVGLRFDPYVHLEASSDPYLSEYTVNLDIFRTAWEAEPAVIFAPPGGGKTATRVAVTRTCWFDIGGAYPFPLPYNLGIAPLTGAPLTSAHHLRLMLESGTCALLTGLAFRPERLLRASAADIRAIASLLRTGLPGSLDYYLAVLRETGTPAGLTPLLERTYALTAPPPPEVLHHFCDVVAASGTDALHEQSEDLFRVFVDLVTGALGFSHVLILIDGIDAVYESQTGAHPALQWVSYLLDRTEQWSALNVFVKLFAPDTAEPSITGYLQQHAISARPAHIVWTADLLIELLRKRIFAASGGRFESLDAISTPALTDVERQIVDAIAPLPRAALQVTRKVLLQYAARIEIEEGQLDEDDIRQAIAWYQRHATPRRQGSASRA